MIFICLPFPFILTDCFLCFCFIHYFSKEKKQAEKTNEEVLAARKRKVEEIQRKYFGGTKGITAGEPASTEQLTTTKQSSPSESAGKDILAQKKQQGVTNLHKNQDPVKKAYSKNDLENLLWDMSDTPAKEELLKKEQPVAPVKRRLDDNFQLQPYSKKVLEALILDMSDTPEKEELLKKEQPVAPVKRRLDDNFQLQPYSKKVLEALILDMSDTPEKEELLKKEQPVAPVKRRLDDNFQLQPYSKKVLEALIFDMSDTPEKQELLARQKTSVASAKRKLDTESNQQPHKKMKKN